MASKKLTKAASVAKELESDDGLTQSERFKQAARELECDDDPERFKERVRKVAKAVLPKSSPSAEPADQERLK